MHQWPDSSVTVTNAEIESYYAENKDDFKSNAVRDIEYVDVRCCTFRRWCEADRRLDKQDKRWFLQSWWSGTVCKPERRLHDPGSISLSEQCSRKPKDFVKRRINQSYSARNREEDIYKMVRLIDVAERPDSVHARHILVQPDKQGPFRMQELLRTAASSGRLGQGRLWNCWLWPTSEDQGSARLEGISDGSGWAWW